jgi:eukaryotic-like serine/threonine-protein kinase
MSNTIDNLIATAQQLVGRVLDDKFKLVACIGIGGSGAVFRADQIALHRTVAVKILNAELASDERLVKRFRAEATSASSLNHPNTVSIIDFGQTPDGLLYLAMEYVSGPTLTQLLQSGAAISVPRALDLTAQILAGIEEAHLAGVVHADLKCDNVIVDQRRAGVDMVKVVDFGIARLANAPRDGEEKSVSGTPEYMAPEVIRGDVPGYASDLYAIGVILFELLTGATPFVAGTTVEILTNHLKLPLPSLSRKRADLQNPNLEQLLSKAMAKQPAHRFADAAEMRAALLEESTRLRTLSTLDACPACGVRSAPTFKFCPECGAPRARVSRAFDVATAIRFDTFKIPFCGRDAELEDLVCHLRAETNANLLVIAGGQGCGKTALLRAAYRRVQSDSLLIYQVGSDPALVETPFFPLRSLLAALLSLPPVCLESDIDREIRAMNLSSRDTPGILQIFGMATDLRELDASVRRSETVVSVRRVIAAAAARANIAIVFEDVDRYDAATQEVIHRLVVPIAGRGNDDLPPIVMTTTPDVATRYTKAPLKLLPLSAEAVAQIVDETLPNLDSALIAKISEGNVSFVQHLLRFASAGGKVDGSIDKEADLIAARLAFLPQTTLEVLQAVAVLGLEGSPAVVAALVESERETSTKGIEEAVRLGLLQNANGDDAALEPSSEVFYASFLVRDIVYASTPADIRRHLHAAAAAMLAKTAASQPAIIGHHFHLAGSGKSAIEFLVKAANQSFDVLDDSGAIRNYQSALLAVRQTLREGDVEDSAATFVEISIRLAELLKNRGELGLAKGTLTEARTWVDRSSLEAIIDQSLASICIVEGDLDGALRLLRRAIGKALGFGAMSLLCELYVDLATCLMRQGSLDNARTELNECLDMVTMGEGITAMDGPQSMWRVLRLQSQLTQTLGDSVLAIRLAEAALLHVTRVQGRLGIARVRAMLASMYERSGMAAKAQGFRDGAIAEMRALGDRRATVELLLAEIPARALMAKGSQSIAQEAQELAAEIGWPEGQRRAQVFTAGVATQTDAKQS